MGTKPVTYRPIREDGQLGREIIDPRFVRRGTTYGSLGKCANRLASNGAQDETRFTEDQRTEIIDTQLVSSTSNRAIFESVYIDKDGEGLVIMAEVRVNELGVPAVNAALEAAERGKRPLEAVLEADNFALSSGAGVPTSERTRALAATALAGMPIAYYNFM